MIHKFLIVNAKNMISTYRLPSTINDYSITFPKDNKSTANLSQKINSSLEIDRLFVCVKEGTKAISILKHFGLYCPDTIITSKTEGTRSQIFFLENMYLAIIWLGDEPPRSPTAINFPARVNWRDTRTSPFGIGLSRKQDSSLLGIDDYPVDDLTIDNYIAYSEQNQKNAIEPLIFLLPDRLKYGNILDRELPQNKKYFQHPLKVKNITDIKISIQTGKRRDSAIINWIKQERLLYATRASEPLMELTFDRGIRGKIFDARPTLPMIFRY